MGKIFKKMNKTMMKGFLGIGIFLTTIRAEFISENQPAIETGFIDLDFTFRHKKTV